MQEKQFFKDVNHENAEPLEQNLQHKRIFSEIDTQIAIEDENELATDLALQSVLQPKLSRFKKGVIFSVVVFLCACIAQTLQWLLESWQANQWIGFSFALATCVFVAVGIIALLKELSYLRKLKQRQKLQQQSQQILLQGKFSFSLNDTEKSQQEAKALCQKLVQMMNLSQTDPTLVQWKQHLDSGYSAQEITYLFSQYVLQPRDKQVQKLISQSAAESAVVIAVSPLALVDMLFLAWRNIRLVNQIAKIYQIELGYWSRLHLFRMVLVNLAFAGATEVIQEMSLDWLSQDIAARFSARFAQGMGAGLLTARLGLKAADFCRPVVFAQEEKPKLSNIQQALLSTLKQTLLQSLKKQSVESVK